MHVALFSPAWPPGRYPNGIVTYVQFMRSELLAQGHRVSVLSGSVEPGQTDPDVYEVGATASERIVGSLASRLLGRTPSEFDAGKTIASTLKRVHARNPIDVFEMEESFGWAAQVARGSSVPVVCKLHGPAFLTMVDEELRTPYGQEKVHREGQGLAQLQAIVSPSRCHLADTLARYELKPAIAEQVVNPLALPADAALWDATRCDLNTLLFVGRFDKVKGGDLVVRAFQKLLAHKPDLRLVFVGPDGGLVQPGGKTIHFQEFVESLNDPALARAIDYRGRLDSGDVVALRPAALVTIVASRRESQGYTALEAMLQACPVVCTDTSGLGEMIEHGVTGLKARTEDADDLAAQVMRIVADPQLGRRLGLAGRDYVIEHHSPAVVVKQALDVYRRAIALHRAGPAARG